LISSETFIQDNLRKIKSKGKAYTNLLKEINMKEIFGMTNIMEKDIFFSQMVLIMRVILAMELDKAKEAGITVMAVNFMAIGKMIVKMDMVFMWTNMEVDMKENMKMIKNMEKEASITMEKEVT